MVDTGNSLLEGIAKQFNNPNHADVEIYIGQYELPAHSIILASQSLFFQIALNGKFREGKDKKLYFTEGSAHAHWRVFEYMYTSDYADEPAQALHAIDDNELVKHVRVYVTAEYFMINSLKQLALKRFKAELDKGWADEFLVDCIREVYESTTESDLGLRRAVIETAYKYRADLWEVEVFRDLVCDGGDFVVDLMRELIWREIS
ncbi:BTB/POZ domain-containing protein [Nemania serpens]|nr:BTB/POZ domain-containing protein [Nemania serpens]